MRNFGKLSNHKSLKDERITLADGDKATTEEKVLLKNSRIVLRKS